MQDMCYVVYERLSFSRNHMEIIAGVVRSYCVKYLYRLVHYSFARILTLRTYITV
jgi:hypothetical protein